MRPRAALFALLIAVLLLPVRTVAWGFDVHRYITGKAIDLLPDGLRPFYEKHRAFIVEHAVDPDLWRTAGWEDESPRHFVDLDAYGPPPFAALPRDYDRAVEQWGREFVTKNGLLPWRTSEIFGQLQRAFEQPAVTSSEAIEATVEQTEEASRGPVMRCLTRQQEARE